jgi:DNA-binding CsgD family transcriptional regulator
MAVVADRAIAQITSRLYAGAVDHAQWPAAMQRLADLLRCDHAFILARESWQGEITFWASAGLDASAQERFRSTHAAEIGLPLFRAAPPAVACARSRFLTDREFERSQYYDEMVRPVRGYRSLNAVLPGSEHGPAVIAFCRPRQAPDFGERDAARLQRLLPHIEAALDLSVRLTRSEESVRSLRALLDALESGVMLVDAAAHPRFVNRRAMHLLARLDGLKITPSGLAACAPERTAGLRALIARVIARASCGGFPAGKARVLIERPSLRPPWLLTVAPMLGAEADRRTASGLAALFIEESALDTQVDAKLLGENFQLTGREADVAALIASGRDVRAIARTLEIGVGTVRTHLKHVFDKTGARSQTRLALKLQAFADRRR